MQITKELPQFENKPSLLVVSGFQSGKLLYAYNGEIKLIKEVEVEDHDYSDNEGFFKRMTSRLKGSMGSGSVLEKKKKHIRDEFLNKFIKEIEINIEKLGISDIYLFSPQESMNSIKDSFSSNLEKKIINSYTGNYIHHKPDQIIKVIQEEKPESVKVMSEEAKKILDKGQD